MKWSNSEFLWNTSSILFSDRFDVRCKTEEDSKIASCLRPKQLEGGRKIRFEGENQKLSFYMLSWKCPLVIQREVLNRGTKKVVFLKTLFQGGRSIIFSCC